MQPVTWSWFKLVSLPFSKLIDIHNSWGQQSIFNSPATDLVTGGCLIFFQGPASVVFVTWIHLLTKPPDGNCLKIMPQSNCREEEPASRHHPNLVSISRWCLPSTILTPDEVKKFLIISFAVQRFSSCGSTPWDRSIPWLCPDLFPMVPIWPPGQMVNKKVYVLCMHLAVSFG